MDSPWIRALHKDRRIRRLENDQQIAVAIIGGGIAGVSTAYFLLNETDLDIAIFEKDLIARGATGHNAGQAVSYFERPFFDLVREYGLDIAKKAHMEIEDAWQDLESIIRDNGLGFLYEKADGHVGYSSKEQVLGRLASKKLKREAGILVDKLKILSDIGDSWIEDEFEGLYELVERRDIERALDTTDPRYIAMMPSPKACMNSAKFTEMLAMKCLERYPGRFAIFEKSEAYDIGENEFKCNLKTVTFERMVLCTNGFMGLKFRDKKREKAIERMIWPVVGYMTGRYQGKVKPSAISYFSHGKPRHDEPYFYVTKRNTGGKGLVCVGGPEHKPGKGEAYDNSHIIPGKVKDEFRDFLKSTYGQANEQDFYWDGLMGYTVSGVRIVGKDRTHASLYYNTGCNGVGILPSIAGAKRISALIAGKNPGKSAFDP